MQQAPPYSAELISLAPASSHSMRFYTAEEVAYRLDRDAESIRQLMRDGQLDGVKWSGQWIVSNDDLRAWLPEETYNQAFGYPPADEA